MQLALWDTAGQEDYERLRPLAYSNAHVILIGFAVDTPDSLDNVEHKVSLFLSSSPRLGSVGKETPEEAKAKVNRRKTQEKLTWFAKKWITEATRLCPGVPIILVGLKKDLREDPVAVEEQRKKSLRFVTTQEGEHVAREISARRYLECSSLSGEGVDDVFEAATRAALLTMQKSEGSGCCVVL